jgi:hypothetical protein
VTAPYRRPCLPHWQLVMDAPLTHEQFKFSQQVMRILDIGYSDMFEAKVSE